MDGSSVSLRLVSMDPLWVALAFLFLALASSLLARRLHSWVPVISAIAFGYCILAQLIHFSLQFAPDSRSFALGSLLVHLWLIWPVVFLVGAVALVVVSLRPAGGRALTIRSSGRL